jgi:IS5 family transposase
MSTVDRAVLKRSPRRIFGFDKVRYRGIAKNHNQMCANFALVNLYLHRKRLLVQRA